MTETEIELEYRLSAEQRELWRSNLPKLRGRQVDVAKQLHKIAKGKESTWKNVVSGFFKGEEGPLRAVFQHSKRSKIVAAALGLSDNELRLRLRAAREHGREVPHGWRIPGFEDLGVFPILEALYSCPEGRGSANTTLSKAPHLSLEALVEIARAKPADGGRIVALIDELALDAKPALRWLEAKLEHEGRPVSDWRDPNLRAGSVVLQTDLNALSDAERKNLMSNVQAASATVFVTTTLDDSGVDWPSDVIVYQPGRGSIYWAAGYLKHLEALLSAHGFSVDFSDLQDWLEDDPRSAWAIERANSLGVVARHVFEGRSLPFTGTDLLTNSIERARAWLEHRDLHAEAVLLEVCGRQALGLMAADMCIRGAQESTYETVARYFVDAAVGLAGPEEWKQVAAPGMIGVVSELVTCGLLRERGGSLSTAQHQLAVVALGHHLAHHLDDVALVGRAATTPRWHGAFLAAAEFLGDPSPIIEVLMRRSVGVRHVAVPALTMVLECDARPSNIELFRQAHLYALRWWASRPPAPAEHPRTIFYGRARRQSALATSAHQLGGRSALVALGQASHRHRGVLGSDWTPALLLEMEPDPAQAALGHTILDDERARAALIIGAPFQIATFHDPQPWRADMRVDDPRDPEALGLSNHDYELWWRTVAIPRLREEPDSDARLIGAKPGFSVAVAMRQNERGTKIWSEALSRALASEVEGAQQAFVSAVARLVEIGGRLNFQAIKSLWAGIEPCTRFNLQHEVRERLVQRQRTYWALGDEEAAWLMREFFDPDSLHELWITWQRDERLHWRPFLMAGLPPSQILDWALDRENEPVGFDWFEEPHLVDQVFDALLRVDDVEFLAEMELRAPDHWWVPVHRRLREYDREHVDCARLNALQRWSTNVHRRASLACEIDPRAGDEQAWLNLAESETKELEKLTRLVQADLASNRKDPWQHTLAVIDRLAEVLDSPLEHCDKGRLAVNTPDDAITEDVARELLRGPVSQILVLLGQGLARENPPPDRETIIRRTFGSPRVRAYILGGACLPWWKVAREVLGDPYVLDVLRAGHDDRADASLTRLRFMGWSRASLIALAGDACLGSAAATVLAERIADGVLDPLGADEITTLLADRGLDPESDAVRALVSSYLNTGPQTLERLTEVVEQRLEPGACAIWWRDLANEIKDPRTLAVLLDAWLVEQS